MQQGQIEFKTKKKADQREVTYNVSCGVLNPTVLCHNYIVRMTSSRFYNNNIQDNVYGAVIMAEALREFIRFI